jgi:hypothetical protein
MTNDSRNRYWATLLLIAVLLIWGSLPALAQWLTPEDRCRASCVGTATETTYTPNIDEGAADIAVDAVGARKQIVCCNNGTTQVLVREDAATGGTVGKRYNGGYVANDGTGACFKITSRGAVYFYDVANLGLAVLSCTTELY